MSSWRQGSEFIYAGTQQRPKIVELVLQGHPQKGSQICRNCRLGSWKTHCLTGLTSEPLLKVKAFDPNTINTIETQKV